MNSIMKENDEPSTWECVVKLIFDHQATRSRGSGIWLQVEAERARQMDTADGSRTQV